MSTVHPVMPVMSRKERRRFLAITVGRALLATTVVLALYYVLPLDRLKDQTIFLGLAIELIVLAAVVSWQVRRVLNSRTPLLVAIDALALSVPLFLIVFAAMYVGISSNDPSNFNTGTLTKTDALYFTVTVFATVGFGDITATSQFGRILVTVQMLLDLVVLGLLIRVFYGAVQEAWRQKAGDSAAAPPVPSDGPADA